MTKYTIRSEIKKCKRDLGIPQAVPRSRLGERAGKVKGATQNADRPAFCIVAAYAKRHGYISFPVLEQGKVGSEKDLPALRPPASGSVPPSPHAEDSTRVRHEANGIKRRAANKATIAPS